MRPAVLLWLPGLLLVPAAATAADAVEVTGLRDPVDKSYRRMVSGAELFDERKSLAPGAELRFKLLPRRPGTNMKDIDVAIVADTFETPLEVAPDNTFALPRDPKALRENASVRPNRKAKTMTWRADIRSPGVPAGMRRLGDLRLECEVGMQAGLISDYRRSFFGLLRELFPDGPRYCYRENNQYLFFAERPLWNVTLSHGERRETVSVDRLYGAAARDPEWRKSLPYCDCEVLMDRAYFMPLGDRSWPDNTLVQFEYMQ